MLSHVRLCNPRTAACQASLPFTISRVCSNSCPHVHKASEAIQPSHPLPLSLLPLPSIFPRIRVFSNELAFPIRWPKRWSFSFSISPSNEYSGLISFRIDWFDLLLVQGTLKSLLQHHSSKASISMLNLLYGPTLTSIHDYWKNHSFDYTDFVGKVMSLLFNMLSRFVIAFLPRNKCLNFMAAGTICRNFGAQENEICHCFHFFHIYLP